MKVDLFFSYTAQYADGKKSAEVSLAEAIRVTWDGDARRYQATNPDMGEASGTGTSQEAAILDYLRARLGLVAKPAAAARNHKRIF